MRKIEQVMIAAIRAGTEFRSGNTKVFRADPNTFEVYLHSNLIAWVTHGVFNSGWRVDINHRVYDRFPTRTTKSRLQALLQEFRHAY